MNKIEYQNIIDQLKHKVFRFARTLLNNNTDAEDITQDVMEKFWRQKDQLKDINNIESYVIQSTKHLCYDHLRRKMVIVKNNESLMHTQNVSTNDDENVEKPEDIKNIIRLAINQLPEKQKTIMHLRDIEGYDFEEIASITNLEINAIRVNLSRARQSVRDALIKNKSL
ncbi:MAG: sigma-70 family RNA polymerase sigma factor [Bacteroidales bacterium]|nr:sigma-70 family RNA polymerase sigma factor [Bacteroidales bacterium]